MKHFFIVLLLSIILQLVRNTKGVKNYDEDLVNRFLTYVKFDTQSDESSQTIPSTRKQCELAKKLKAECVEMGLSNVTMDDNCYVMATLPGNVYGKPVIGFISHMDTSPDASGLNVKPMIHSNYDGKDLVLKNGVVIKVDENPLLKKYIGESIITSEGDTLLGADDKAGIAEIMSAMHYLLNHPEIKHGDVRIGFTPDEEIGRGTEYFSINQFGAKYAYTMDGSDLGDYNYETFNAAQAILKIKGHSVHPGYAKNKMLNAQEVAIEFHKNLPEMERPEYTEGREGFFHLDKMEGQLDSAMTKYIIRDHDKTKFEARKQLMQSIADKLNEKYAKFGKVIDITITDQYYNMKEKIMPVYDPVITKLESAMKKAGIKAEATAVRGGTDGAWLSFAGLPTPNVFAGGLNFHSVNEWAPIISMEKAKQVIIELVQNYAQ